MGRRVLIVNETPVPRDERVHLEGKSLARAGYEVLVVCPQEDPADPSFRVHEGIGVFTYPPAPPARGLPSHAWELIYCWLRSARLALSLWRHGGFDVIHACNPPDTFFLLGAIFKPLGVRYVFAEHDLCPELWLSRFGDRGLMGRLLHRGLLWMERMSYRVADAVIVPNDSYASAAVERGGVPADAVFVVRNCPDLRRIRQVDPDPSLAQGRAHLVCYTGCMNPQDGVDYLLRAIAHLVHEAGRTDTQFAILGTGDAEEELQALARDLDIEDFVTFTGWVTDAELMCRYMSTADACVTPDPKTPLNERSSFMKVYDYMAVGRPVVAFDLPETRVTAGGAALYATPDDVQDFAEKIALLLDDPDLRRRLGACGRRRIEDALTWEHQEPQLLAAYQRLFPDEAPSREEGERGSGGVEGGPDIRSPVAVPLVRVDSVEGKQQFLDFWKLPYATGCNGQAAVSLLSADGLEARHRNAVVTVSGTGDAGLYRIGNGCGFYGRVFPIGSVPADLSVVAPVSDRRGDVVSYVLQDPARDAYYIPFDLDEAFLGFYLERYAKGRRFPPPALLKVYYKMKPLMSRALRAAGRRWIAAFQEQRATFPEWPLDLSFERLKRFVLTLLVSASRGGRLPFIWFWPEGKEWCLVLSHDVETGLAENPGIWRLIDAEQSNGLRSSFNVVPFRYEVTESALDRLRRTGCEVGVHGYDHDGDLFGDRSLFAARAARIDELARSWGASGFRSASTYRDAALLSSMGFAYDSSFFDTDPYEPQPGGCLSLYPYFIGDMVEIPMTLPQDHTLLAVRKEPDLGIWRQKLVAIKELGGMACLDAHPDEGYVGDEDKVHHYRDFLDPLRHDGRAWNPLPGELASWWKHRRGARVVPVGDGCRIEGGAAGMTARWAEVRGDELVFVDGVEEAGR